MKKVALKVTVFYEGSCPFCTSALGVYKRADADNALLLVDVSYAAFSGDGRSNRSDAMAKSHLRLADGRQVSGAQSFVEIWRALPSWRWMVKVESIPGAVPMLEVLYRLFLRTRPWVVRGFKRSFENQIRVDPQIYHTFGNEIVDYEKHTFLSDFFGCCDRGRYFDRDAHYSGRLVRILE